MTAREAAVAAVELITDKGRPIHQVVAESLEGIKDQRDRALAKRLTEGTVERLISLDYVLNSYSKTPVKKMKPLVRAILRTGAYQLLCMDNIPASAACNEAVKLMKSRGLTGLSGFVNGVLRTISRETTTIKEKMAGLSGMEGLEIKYSVPAWLLKQWQRDYGPEAAEKIAAAQFDSQPLYFRVNLSKCSLEECRESLEKEGVSCKTPKLNLPEVFKNFELPVLEVEAPEGLEGLTAFKKGWFAVQDVSSVLVGLAAEIQGGEEIIDLCAAPGGKTLHLCDLLKQKGKGGRVNSRDVSEKKIALINQNLNRQGFDNADLSVADASILDTKAINKFDMVLADLPCSGTGVTGRKPDIKYNMTEAAQKELVELQGRILENAVKYLKKGGRIIFSTCTLNREENEKGMKVLEAAGLKKELEAQLIPGLHSADGFFISRYRKV